MKYIKIISIWQERHNKEALECDNGGFWNAMNINQEKRQQGSSSNRVPNCMGKPAYSKALITCFPVVDPQGTAFRDKQKPFKTPG